MKSINAKLLISGLLLALLSSSFGLLMLRSNRDAAEMASAIVAKGIDPIDQLEIASRNLADLERRFMETPPRADAGPMLGFEEGKALLAGLGDILRNVRGASGMLDRGIPAIHVDQLIYSINRLRVAEGEVTQRLVRRELAGIIADIDSTIALLRQDILSLRDGSLSERRTIDQLILFGGASGLIAGAALIIYLSRSIARPIRNAASALRQIGGVQGDDPKSPSNGDLLQELDDAIRFLEAVMEQREKVSERRQRASVAELEKTLGAQQKRLRFALDSLRKPLCLVDGKGRMIDANEGFLDLFPGLRRGSEITEWTEHLDLAALLVRRVEDELLSRDNGLVCRVRCHPNPMDRGIIAIIEDISQEEAVHREFERLSSQDSLTGLPNREAFYGFLETALAKPDASVTLSVFDIVGFKSINTTLGLSAGDDLLRHIGRRLQGLALPGSFVARLDGDEFGLVSTGDTAPGDPELFGRAILQDFESRPVVVAGRPLSVRLAVGMVPNVRHEGDTPPDARTIMRDCEIALEAAKKNPADPFCVYAPEVKRKHQTRQDMERDLRDALLREEFELHFQPFVDTKRGCVSGFEALVRWQSPTRGRVSPAAFIPLMEELGLIAPLGLFVLRDACRQAAKWPENLTLSINLSPRQFDTPRILEDVSEALRSSGLDPRRLQLEVTESLFLSDADRVLDTLNALRKLGISVSMDDFGTGYSSLGYLSRFPFDKIKIDQSFVRDLTRKENMAIVRAVMGLGASMKLSVIAEGVETAEQMAKLAAEGCVEMQGYLFSPPRPAGELKRMTSEIREGFRTGRYDAPETVAITAMSA